MYVYLEEEKKYSDDLLLLNSDNETIFFIEANYDLEGDISSWAGENAFGIGSWNHKELHRVISDIEAAYNDRVIDRRLNKNINIRSLYNLNIKKTNKKGTK